MSGELYNVLGLALVADYFNVSYLRDNGRGNGLDFLCKKTIYDRVAIIFNQLNSKFTSWVCDEDENYAWFRFKSQDDKNLVDDYFEKFNHSHRVQNLIAMPNLYEGTPYPKHEVCDFYLEMIESSLEHDLVKSVAIPFGPSDRNPKNRQFMVYNQNKMFGLHDGVTILKGHYICSIK